MLFVSSFLIAVYLFTVIELTERKVHREAIDHGVAYWCVVDHKKVFSWEPCEEKD
jgi:hypothetical protein